MSRQSDSRGHQGKRHRFFLGRGYSGARGRSAVHESSGIPEYSGGQKPGKTERQGGNPFRPELRPGRAPDGQRAADDCGSRSVPATATAQMVFQGTQHYAVGVWPGPVFFPAFRKISGPSGLRMVKKSGSGVSTADRILPWWPGHLGPARHDSSPSLLSPVRPRNAGHDWAGRRPRRLWRLRHVASRASAGRSRAAPQGGR